MEAKAYECSFSTSIDSRTNCDKGQNTKIARKIEFAAKKRVPLLSKIKRPPETNKQYALMLFSNLFLERRSSTLLMPLLKSYFLVEKENRAKGEKDNEDE